MAAGETVIGSGAGRARVAEGKGVHPRHAVVQGTPAGRPRSGRASPSAEILVNGVRLGADPTPLLHGDKIQIGPHELLVVDSARAGSTQLFDSGAFADLTPRPAPSLPRRRHDRRPAGLSHRRPGVHHGRPPLVSAGTRAPTWWSRGNEVSRQHAEIRGDAARGTCWWTLSVNGTYVNGERIGRRTRLLPGRRDPDRERRVPLLCRARGAAPRRPLPRRVPQGPPSPAAARRASIALSDTMHGVGARHPSPSRVTPTTPMAAPLASLLFRSGELKGRRLPIKVPVVNIGRGDYNDVVIADPSVSTMHAKLQRREAIWILTDLGSTNGTFVEGERFTGEVPLGPGHHHPVRRRVGAVRAASTTGRRRPSDSASRSGGAGPGRCRSLRSRRPGVPTRRRGVPPQRAGPIRVAAPDPRARPRGWWRGLLILVAILAYLLLS